MPVPLDGDRAAKDSLYYPSLHTVEVPLSTYRLHLPPLQLNEAGLGDGTGRVIAVAVMTVANFMAYWAARFFGFTELTDTPSSYVGQAGKRVIVNDSEDGLVFEDLIYKRRQITIVAAGTLVAGNQTPRFAVHMGRPFHALEVWLDVDTPPSGDDIIVDLHKNGTTIFTNQAHRPRILADEYVGHVTTIDVDDIADGDYFQLGVDQVGSGSPGADLTITLVII